MAEETKQSVAYLRALKQSDVLAAEAAPAPAGEPNLEPDLAGCNVEVSPPFQGAEKRRSVRYKCEGSAELRAQDCDVRTWAAFQDVSLHGCYVESQATYPVGTLLHMKLEANGVRVETIGEVRVNYPYLGMGIAFQKMSEENRAQLKKLLGAISHPTVVMGHRIASSLAGGDDAGALVANPAATLRALAQFFENREMLMRDDFLKILRGTQEKSRP
jgi:hypothetical protein